MEPQPVAVQTSSVPLAASIPAPSSSSDQLSGKLAAAEEKISLLEREKQRIKNVSYVHAVSSDTVLDYV